MNSNLVSVGWPQRVCTIQPATGYSSIAI